MADSLTSLELSAAQVAAYLEQHLDFLVAYPDLAQRLQIPKQRDGVANLVAWQLQSLRERNQNLGRQLHELTEIAAENERLMARVQRLSLAIFNAPDLAQGLQALRSCLQQEFQVEQVQLWLLTMPAGMVSADWLHLAAQGEAAPSWVEERVQLAQPWSGRLTTERLQHIFGSAGSQLQSVALLPLAEYGVLALGSENPDRFQPGMGTLFLGMLADAVTLAIRRYPGA